jgi:glycosyltransferase involved in cell wall biosynthesis
MRYCNAVNPLTINYLLEDTALFGGVKVVLRQADLLAGLGHRVRVVTKGGPPVWYRPLAELTRVEEFRADLVPPADVTVATYWTTIEPALALDSGQVVHYCQGFEGIYTHNRDQHSAIEAAYRHRLPALVVTRHLAEMLRERFHRPARVVVQPLETAFRADPPWRRRRQPPQRPRILVMSPYEIDWKGVRTALEAVALLGRWGRRFTLVRISQWPMGDEERRLLEADEFHTHLDPSEVARVLRSCHLLLAPSWRQEGFGLPVLEAMACGVPVVASDVPAFRDWTDGGARLVRWDAPAAFAEAAAEILDSPSRWRGLRRRGLRVARRFSERSARRSAENAMRWVAGGAWQREIGQPT